MTKTKQDQNAKPAAVELRDDALDRAAGGDGRCLYVATGEGAESGDGSVRTITGGTTKPRT